MRTTTKHNSKSFADAVREVVRKIPKGSTMSYREVAEKAGNARAARAVARIMARNFDPRIPCHRVIRSDGTVGGYNRGGEEQKRSLLLKEKPSYA